MRCRTNRLIGTAAIAQLAEVIDRLRGLLFWMLHRRQIVDQRTCRHDLSGWARNSATDTICQFLRVTATIAKLLPESWDHTVRSASSALAAPNMQRCDLGDGSAFSPNLCHETVSRLFSIRHFVSRSAFFSEEFFSFRNFSHGIEMDSVEWHPDFTSGVASQPQLGMTPNSACIFYVLRRSGRRRRIKNRIGDFLSKI